MWLQKASSLASRQKSAAILKASRNTAMRSCRGKVTTITGGIMARPGRLTWGRLMVIGVFTPLIWFGTWVSKEGAAFLEEKEIFIPEGEEDEDD